MICFLLKTEKKSLLAKMSISFVHLGTICNASFKRGTDKNGDTFTCTNGKHQFSLEISGKFYNFLSSKIKNSLSS